MSAAVPVTSVPASGDPPLVVPLRGGASPNSPEHAEVEKLAPPAPSATLLVGECTDARHPTLVGRVRVRLIDVDGVERELWMPALHGLSVRAHDRVLLSHPQNWDEPVVIGVIDGFARRPVLPKQPARSLELLGDESVTVVDSAGTPLIEVAQGEGGPTLRLLTTEMHVDVSGKLRLSAESIELSATAGQAKLLATEDVIVRGEKVRLN